MDKIQPITQRFRILFGQIWYDLVSFFLAMTGVKLQRMHNK